MRGLAAAVGALGLAVREPPPAVVAEDLRLVVCGERGPGDLRLRGLAPLFLVLGLDLVQQGVQPGAIERFLLRRPAARLRPEGRRFRSRLYGRPGDRLGDLGGSPALNRPCARGSDSGGSPVLNRCFFGSRGPPPLF